MHEEWSVRVRVRASRSLNDAARKLTRCEVPAPAKADVRLPHARLAVVKALFLGAVLLFAGTVAVRASRDARAVVAEPDAFISEPEHDDNCHSGGDDIACQTGTPSAVPTPVPSYASQPPTLSYKPSFASTSFKPTVSRDLQQPRPTTGR